MKQWHAKDPLFLVEISNILGRLISLHQSNAGVKLIELYESTIQLACTAAVHKLMVLLLF
ncbi:MULTISPECIES: hypothetical protein [Peribacillus]|uniref:hypothetical protein n=1 Tax=Peribacillus TaxID=2675229 RepID=UPI00203C9B50|nr:MULTISPECIES: hypothetical protein [Peribacillus]MCM3676032.1 hypothetical protein [Peribacillus simplex]MDQ0883987.1 hypothetical protein [Peribacillus sp. V2I11]